MVKALDKLLGRWHLLQHPFYEAWSAGRLERERLQLYAAQYYRHVQTFPAHLRTVAARAEGELRALVEENLAEEEAPGRTHTRLWREFAAAVGVSPEGLVGRPTLDGVQALVDTYARICSQGTLGEAVAALYVYEAQVPEVSSKKIEGLRRWYGVSAARGLAYFAVHEEADVRHRAAWRGWLAARAAEEPGDLLAAGEEALRALWGALDSIHMAPSRP